MNRDHTVGSHSDDRGGDSDRRCDCEDNVQHSWDNLKDEIRKLYGVKKSHYINFEPRLNQLIELFEAELERRGLH